MVFGSFGVEVSESELRTLCDCTPISGTDALMAVDAARQLGFPGTAKYTLDSDELQSLVADGHYPVVFIDLRPIDGIREMHALVIVEMDQHEAIVLDPSKGERALSLRAFNSAWTMGCNLTILVER